MFASIVLELFVDEYDDDVYDDDDEYFRSYPSEPGYTTNISPDTKVGVLTNLTQYPAATPGTYPPGSSVGSGVGSALTRWNPLTAEAAMKQSPNGHPHLAPLASPHLGEEGVEYIGKFLRIP